MPDFKSKVAFDNVSIISETPNAILCVIDGVKYWIPLSQVDDDSEVWKSGEEGKLVISEWIANEKRLI